MAEGGIDLWGLGISNTVEEGSEFDLEGLTFFDWDILFFYTKEATLFNEMAFLVHKIEREVGFRLEDTDFADFFKANAARFDIGDGSVFKSDSSVGDIFGFRNNVNADSIDAGNGRLDELEDDADVVDHEVEDDADFGASNIEGGQAVSGDKARVADGFFEEAHDRVVVLDVADLDDGVFGFGGADDLIGFRKGCAQGLFN